MTREEIKKRMDELARKYAETHDQDVKAELKVLIHRLAKVEQQHDLATGIAQKRPRT